MALEPVVLASSVSTCGPLASGFSVTASLAPLTTKVTGRLAVPPWPSSMVTL